jgi:two-component system sensor histidine kinase CpxA
MQADISTLENMISNLLTLARIDASEEHCRREPVHMGRLLQQIVRDASFEGIAGNKSVVQTGHFDLYAMGDTGLLHSCVENVVRNALKHTPPGGLVEVSLTESSNHGDRTLNITTSDEGKGVPGDSLEQIFDPFFRIASSGTHERGGAGLGLSISKRIVSLYGGTIAAQNLASSGLRVTITLPAA